MQYPEWMTNEDIMEFEHDMNRFIDLMEPFSLEAINLECQIVAEEQRLAAMEEYVVMIQQSQIEL